MRRLARSAFLIAASLARSGGPALADGIEVKAQAYPIPYAPAYESHLVTGDGVAQLEDALSAEREYMQGDPGLLMNSFQDAHATAKAGMPSSKWIPIQVAQGFVDATVESKYKVQSMLAPWSQGDSGYPVHGAEAYAASNISGIISAPGAAGHLIPIKVGFPFLAGLDIGAGNRTWVVTRITGEFLVDGFPIYSFIRNETSSGVIDVYVNGIPADEIETQKIESFRYQESKSMEDYLNLEFTLPSGHTYGYNLTVFVRVDNHLTNGDIESHGIGWATIDPLMQVDPEWEYAHLVQLEPTATIDYPGNPLAGGPGEALWAELPEPEAGGLGACLGLLLLRRWQQAEH